MAPRTRRWLNIIVDGNVDLTSYWPKIVSEYLEKIVRSFCDNCQEQGNNSAHELGLVLYNGNSSLGYYAQFIEWTNDMGYFLSCLPNLVLNGDESNQTVITKALVDSLLMFTEATKSKEERHCVLVAMREPMPVKTQVPVPKINKDGLCGTELEVRDVDYFEVVRIFALLGISFSLITPTEHPIFRAMFNLGNNINEAEYNPLLDDKMGELTVMLSRNFKVARQAILHENIADENVAEGSSSRKRSAESMVEATDHVTRPNVTACDLPVREDLCSAAMATLIGEKTIEKAKAVIVIPEAILSTTSEEPPQQLVAVQNPRHDRAVFSAPTPMNVFDDIMLDLINSTDDDDHVILATKRSKPSSLPMTVFSFEDLFQPPPPPHNEPSTNSPHNNELTMPSSSFYYTTTMENPLEAALRAFEQEYELALMPSSKDKTPKITNNASNGGDSLFSGAAAGSMVIRRLGESSSASFAAPQGGNDERGNFTMFQPISSSTQMLPVTSNHEADFYVPSTSALPPHQNFIGASTTHFASHGNDAMGNYTSSNIHHQSEASSSSVIQIQHGQFSSSAMQIQQQQHVSAAAAGGYQYLQGIVANNNNYYAPSSSHNSDAAASVVGASSALVPTAPVAGLMPQASDPRFFSPSQASFVDFNQYVHTWEGSLTGSTSHGTSSYRAKAFRKSTSPLTLTVQWMTKLSINHYIPQKAVEHTKRIMKTQPDSVLFHITEFNNLHLYDFLMSSNMYAKIDLPSQALILSPTENSLFYEGTVFPEGTLFVEPA